MTTNRDNEQRIDALIKQMNHYRRLSNACVTLDTLRSNLLYEKYLNIKEEIKLLDPNIKFTTK
jgi:hypothetical protein